MSNMRCFGKYLNTESCDLCAAINPKMAEDCKYQYTSKNDLQNYLYAKKKNCPYKKTMYIDYEEIEICTKGQLCRYAEYPVCEATEDCFK